MTTAAFVMTVIVALLHFGFMAMETVGWDKMGRRFGFSKEEVQTTKLLAANQGIYNGAVAATILWAMATGNEPAVMAMLVFVIFVGLFGAATVSGTILAVQALPAAIALVLQYLS